MAKESKQKYPHKISSRDLPQKTCHLPRYLQQMCFNKKFPGRGAKGRSLQGAGLSPVKVLLVVALTVPLQCTSWISSSKASHDSPFPCLPLLSRLQDWQNHLPIATAARGGQESQSCPVTICRSPRVDAPSQTERKTHPRWHFFFFSFSHPFSFFLPGTTSQCLWEEQPSCIYEDGSPKLRMTELEVRSLVLWLHP